MKRDDKVRGDLEGEELGLRLGEVLAGSLEGIRSAALEVLEEAQRPGAVAKGSSIDRALDGLMKNILAQNKASELFRAGYEQGFKGADDEVPESIAGQVHVDCYVLGYELGRLARERLSEKRSMPVAADWALGMVLKDALLLER